MNNAWIKLDLSTQLGIRHYAIGITTEKCAYLIGSLKPTQHSKDIIMIRMKGDSVETKLVNQFDVPVNRIYTSSLQVDGVIQLLNAQENQFATYDTVNNNVNFINLNLNIEKLKWVSRAVMLGLDDRN